MDIEMKHVRIEIEENLLLNDQVTRPSLRTQESLTLEAYCDERIKPKFKGRAIPLKAFRNIVFNKAFKITPDEEIGTTPQQMWEIFSTADSNNDEKIDYLEIKEKICSRRSTINDRQVKALSTILQKVIKSSETSTPLPGFIICISLTQIAFFFVYNGKLKETNPFIFDPEKKHELWRFITYMFIHNGYRHLALNMTTQLAAGVLQTLLTFLTKSQFIKQWVIVVVYFSGVVLGSLTGLIASSDQLMVGSSAGAFALCFGLFSYSVRAIFKDKLKKVLLIVLICSLVVIYELFYYIISDTLIKFDRLMVHFSGAFAGLLMGFFLAFGKREKSGYIFIC